MQKRFSVSPPHQSGSAGRCGGSPPVAKGKRRAWTRGGSLFHRYGRTIVRFFLVVGASVLMWALLSWFFTIRTIEVVGEGFNIDIAREHSPKNILFFPSERIKKELMVQYPLLGEVIIKKKYPTTLIIHLVPRKPAALLVSRGHEFALDAMGYVVGIDVGGNLPKLFFDVGSFPIGARVSDTRISQILTFVIAASPVPLESVEQYGHTALRVRLGATDIFLPQNGDLGAKAATLQTILAGFRIKGTLPKVVDLRFEKPIITN